MASLARFDIELFMADQTGWANSMAKSRRTQPEWNGTPLLFRISETFGPLEVYQNSENLFRKQFLFCSIP